MRRKYIKINIEQFKIAKDKIQFIEDIGASNISRHDWKRICTYSLPVEFIKKYAESINWAALCMVSTLPPTTIKELEKDFADKMDWYHIFSSNHYIEILVEEGNLENHIDWEAISYRLGLTERFMNKYIHKLDCQIISVSQRLSEAFILKHINKLDLKAISAYQCRSETLLTEIAKRIDAKSMVCDGRCSFEFLKRNIEKINIETTFERFPYSHLTEEQKTSLLVASKLKFT
ncbi:hypothetical protein [Anaerospora sp.]|uniref:hypothetical protein n=1 Tax=Anaerospora sp. TaxID=1960278 RepID=UPI00289C7049|nr:hypothetical protein [Anaerospora sp.]